MTIMAKQQVQENQSVGIRFAAYLIDGLLIMAVMLPIVFLMGFGLIFNPFMSLAFIAVMILLAVGIFLYFVIMEGTYGATLGKMAVGIKVVREDGSKCTMTDALVRNLLRIVDGFFIYLIGAILIWTSEKRQRLGDMAAHTIVVRAEKKAA